MEVKVWNDNTYVYQEKFLDRTIVIEPNQYVVMEQDEAIQFLGAMPPQGIMADADGRPDPRGYKKLRIASMTEVEKLKSKGINADGLVCHRCKYVASGQSDLDEHVMANHYQDLVNADEVKSKLKK